MMAIAKERLMNCSVLFEIKKNKKYSKIPFVHVEVKFDVFLKSTTYAVNHASPQALNDGNS